MTDVDDEPTDPRAETGPIQFGEDWPGVFIRGDNALHFAHWLRQNDPKSAIAQLVTKGLAETLEQANAHNSDTKPLKLKPLKDCLLQEHNHLAYESCATLLKNAIESLDPPTGPNQKEEIEAREYALNHIIPELRNKAKQAQD